MVSPTLSTQSVVNQLMQLGKDVQKQFFEAQIFVTREKIIDHAVIEISNIIFLHPSCVTAKDIGLKLKKKYKHLRDLKLIKGSSLTPREEKFKTYMTKQVMDILKAPAPSQVRSEILDSMYPFDQSMVEFITTRFACELLASLDKINSRVVDDLLRQTS